MLEKSLKHLAIIMDGNGRWASERGLKRSLGHKEGAAALEKLAIKSKELGIEVLSVYAFSTDNFKRSSEEVDYLMNLFVEMFNYKFKNLLKENIKVVFSGSKENLRKDVKEAMEKIENETSKCDGATLNVCLNYGAQEEIIRASEKYHEDLLSGKAQKGISRDEFYKYMDQFLPPIDLLIRTGGEKRLSNFMLYQLMYAELFFIDTYFPDFTPKQLEKICNEFTGRDRRFGGINEKKANS